MVVKVTFGVFLLSLRRFRIVAKIQVCINVIANSIKFFFGHMVPFTQHGTVTVLWSKCPLLSLQPYNG